MKVEDFSDDELQLMRLGFKTPHQLALYFEGSKEEKRYYILNVTVAPVIFVRSQEIGDLISIVIRDGYQEASRKLGVSVVKCYFTPLFYNHLACFIANLIFGIHSKKSLMLNITQLSVGVTIITAYVLCIPNIPKR